MSLIAHRAAGRQLFDGLGVPAVDALGVLLGMGILLTSATQLRLPGLPIGPGELILTLSLVLLGFLMLRSGPAPVHAIAGPWMWFWLATAFAMSAGWIVGTLSAESVPSSGRDGAAYGFSAAMVALLVAGPRPDRTIKVALVTLLTATPLVLGALFLLALGGRDLGPVNVWYEGVRFRAWAANPNQLALLLAPQPWLAVAIGGRGWRRLLLIAGLAVVLVLGIATGSDALAASWAFGGVVWFVAAVTATITRRRDSIRSAGLARVVLPMCLLFVAVAEGGAVVDWVAERGSQTYVLAGQGPDRLARWRFGLEAVAQSPIVGFGPGSFAGNRSAFAAEEAHSTPIDWATSTGLVGLLTLGLLIGWIAVRVVRRRQVWPILALLSVLSFMSLHYVLRHPAAWFYLVVLSTGSSLGAPLRRHIYES